MVVVNDPFGDLCLVGKRFPIHICDACLSEVSEMALRVSMTVETPSHAKRFALLNHIHFVDVAVATFAPHSRLQVNRVIEVGKVRKFVNPHPLQRFASLKTVPNWL